MIEVNSTSKEWSLPMSSNHSYSSEENTNHPSSIFTSLPVRVNMVKVEDYKTMIFGITSH